MRLGVFGGSFNPIHHGHLILAQYALEDLELDQIIFLPSFRPPHKLDNGLSSFEDRCRMLELALEGREAMVISRLEEKRQGPSYSFDSLNVIEEGYGAFEIYFLIGADSLMELDSWYRSRELLERFSFGVAPRPGRSLKEMEEKIHSLGGNIRIISSPFIEISSSTIRQRFREGKSIGFQLPRAVEDYIYEKKLYSQSP